MKIIESENQKENVIAVAGDILLINDKYYIMGENKINGQILICFYEFSEWNIFMFESDQLPEIIEIGSYIENLGTVKEIFDGEESEINLCKKTKTF